MFSEEDQDHQDEHHHHSRGHEERTVEQGPYSAQVKWAFWIGSITTLAFLIGLSAFLVSSGWLAPFFHELAHILSHIAPVSMTSFQNSYFALCLFSVTVQVLSVYNNRQLVDFHGLHHTLSDWVKGESEHSPHAHAHQSSTLFFRREANPVFKANEGVVSPYFAGVTAVVQSFVFTPVYLFMGVHLLIDVLQILLLNWGRKLVIFPIAACEWLVDQISRFLGFNEPLLPGRSLEKALLVVGALTTLAVLVALSAFLLTNGWLAPFFQAMSHAVSHIIPVTTTVLQNVYFALCLVSVLTQATLVYQKRTFLDLHALFDEVLDVVLFKQDRKQDGVMTSFSKRKGLMSFFFPEDKKASFKEDQGVVSPYFAGVKAVVQSFIFAPIYLFMAVDLVMDLAAVILPWATHACSEFCIGGVQKVVNWTSIHVLGFRQDAVSHSSGYHHPAFGVVEWDSDCENSDGIANRNLEALLKSVTFRPEGSETPGTGMKP